MVFAVVGHKFQEVGWPDRYVHHRDWCGWLEFKDEHTRLGRKQAKIIEMLNIRRPGSAYVVRAPDRIEDHRGELLSYFTDLMEAINVLHTA